LIRVRSLVPGRPNGGSSPNRRAEEPAADRSSSWRSRLSLWWQSSFQRCSSCPGSPRCHSPRSRQPDLISRRRHRASSYDPAPAPTAGKSSSTRARLPRSNGSCSSSRSSRSASLHGCGRVGAARAHPACLPNAFYEIPTSESVLHLPGRRPAAPKLADDLREVMDISL